MSRNNGKVKMVTYIKDHKFLFEHSSIEIARQRKGKKV
jgi:hypothetical protein